MELVSIIMPAYNCADFIAESIRSVLAQTYTNWELLIVDDCSTDKTAEVIASFADPRIHYQRNTHNMRAAATRNEAIKIAKGRYIAFLDSDDLWLPDKLEKQIAFMQAHDYSMTYVPYYVLTQDRTCNYLHTAPKSLTYFQLTRWDRIGCLTVMYDADKLGKVLMPAILNREDYAYWLVLLRQGITAYGYQEPLAVYRSHNGMSNGSKWALMKYHYQLFNAVLGYSKPVAAWLTLRNDFFYIWYTIKDNKRIPSCTF